MIAPSEPPSAVRPGNKFLHWRRLGLPPLKQLEFHQDLIARIERLPGVQPARFVAVTPVTERYFETTDILILRGRAFTVSEMGGEQLVAVVNEAMANVYWGSGQSPMGKHFRLFGDSEDRVVIGVARNTAFADLDPALLSREIASEIRAAGLLTDFGLMAMLLATPGVHGLTSNPVSHRTGEIGLRMAMAASLLLAASALAASYLPARRAVKSCPPLLRATNSQHPLCR